MALPAELPNGEESIVVLRRSRPEKHLETILQKKIKICIVKGFFR
jgi:hypothetical protein